MAWALTVRSTVIPPPRLRSRTVRVSLPLPPSATSPSPAVTRSSPSPPLSVSIALSSTEESRIPKPRVGTGGLPLKKLEEESDEPPPIRVSAPSPPFRVSAPAPPPMTSLSASPLSVSDPAPPNTPSLPAPALTVSLPSPELMVSWPPCPSMRSSPAVPGRMSLPLVPVMSVMSNVPDSCSYGGGPSAIAGPIGYEQNGGRVSPRALANTVQQLAHRAPSPFAVCRWRALRPRRPIADNKNSRSPPQRSPKRMRTIEHGFAAATTPFSANRPLRGKYSSLAYGAQPPEAGNRP